MSGFSKPTRVRSYAADTPAADCDAGRPNCCKASARSCASIRRGAGDAQFSLAFPTVRTPREVARLAAEVFALPGRIAAASKRRLAIALDEFQTIASFDGGSVEHALRAAVQEQRQVGYVFAGSEPSLMERMLGPRRPFYKAGPVVRLEKIDEDEFAAFIDDAVCQERVHGRARPRPRDRRAGRQRPLRRSTPRARDLGRRAGRQQTTRSGSKICTSRCRDCLASRTRSSRSRGNG